jgi:hypothetical protein
MFKTNIIIEINIKPFDALKCFEYLNTNPNKKGNKTYSILLEKSAGSDKKLNTSSLDFKSL